MATLREERARLQFLEEHGHGDEKVHVVFIKEEVRKRVKNKTERTRLIRELDDSETYSQFNFQFDRYIELCGGNPSIAYTLILRCLEQLSDDMIRRLAEGEHEAEHPTVGNA